MPSGVDKDRNAAISGVLFLIATVLIVPERPEGQFFTKGNGKSIRMRCDAERNFKFYENIMCVLVNRNFNDSGTLIHVRDYNKLHATHVYTEFNFVQIAKTLYFYLFFSPVEQWIGDLWHPQ